MDPAEDWRGKELRELNEIEWEVLLSDQMRALGTTGEDVYYEREPGEWKVTLAWFPDSRDLLIDPIRNQ